MMDRMVRGKSIAEWIRKIPVLGGIIKEEEVFWTNPGYARLQSEPLGMGDQIKEASDRLGRFASFLQEAYPETREAGGMIESPLVEIKYFKEKLGEWHGGEIGGSLFLKCDNDLPISGSIKARGGIYEVLKHAEDLAFEHRLINPGDDYSVLRDQAFRNFFSNYSIAVGSTGNLGLSIGLIGSKLGFKVTVHRSADAKEWKKTKLRSLGVEVVEYESDYSAAVEQGRKQAESDPSCYFIDDENSRNLFFGYAVAAERLKRQFKEKGIKVDSDHPLFVYLPCGVGGGPGGIAYGLKEIFKNDVHCFFAEPIQSPCMLVSLATGLHDEVSVNDFGLENRTAADGLAVGRASGFVSRTIEPLLAGIFTVKDRELFRMLSGMWETEGIFVEPSAAAGAVGPVKLMQTEEGRAFLQNNGLMGKMDNAIHIVWATGGSMVPENERKGYLLKN
ncbi:D-serine ammonia-lyase [Neobacillus piezotolerans]|uniref:Probable D-serine dehydratase n=2 Tax=Neobacillus piezotolerans TaxID=2259171 RepID=A0A3D8GPY6_9BACI|nr:D-serine ammonia-lyase [Neobacillus piezotolerans]